MKLAKKKTPTKERLLDAAQELMLAKGFSATTVDEICGAAKLTKGSFFHYFESKDELGKVLLERFCAQSSQRHQRFSGSEADPLKRVYRYLDGVAETASDPALSRGCLLGTFAQELSDVSPRIRMSCAKGFENWAGQFAKDLSLAKARHAPKASFRPHELAEHLIAILEGSLILGKAKKDKRVLKQNLRHYKNYLKSLLKR